MNRPELLAALTAPLGEYRPVRLSRINAGLAAAGQEPTTFEEIQALARPVPARRVLPSNVSCG